MKKKKLFLILVSILGFWLTACEKSSSGNDPEYRTEEPAKPTAGYYDEMMSKPIGDCAHPDELRFVALANLGLDKFGESEDRKDLVVRLLLSLRQDGTYFVAYSEDKVLLKNETEERLQNIFSKNIEGNWSLDGKSKLNIEGFGVANTLQIGNSKKVSLKVQMRIHDPRVNSLQIVLEKTLSVSGPHGETAAEYCH